MTNPSKGILQAGTHRVGLFLLNLALWVLLADNHSGELLLVLFPSAWLPPLWPIPHVCVASCRCVTTWRPRCWPAPPSLSLLVDQTANCPILSLAAINHSNPHQKTIFIAIIVMMVIEPVYPLIINLTQF